jgi:hypothetical protein
MVPCNEVPSLEAEKEILMSKGIPTPDRLVNDAEKLGFFRRSTGANHTLKWTARCSRCDTTEHLALPLASPAAAIAKKCTAHGWRLNKDNNHVCPKCVAHEKENKVSKMIVGPDPKIARKIFAALDDHFDEPKRLYTPGYSDERIAKELDVSLDVVLSLRRGAYGELAEDPMTQMLRDDLELLRMEGIELQKRYAADMATHLGKITELENKINHTVLRKVG